MTGTTLQCITGTSMHTFTMDKTLEQGMGCLCGENAGELAGIIGKVRSDVMNIGFILMGISCLLFLLLALLFAILKGKAAILISGFNTIPKYQRELYDQDRMSRDQRNAFLIWAGIMGIGAILSYFISQYMAVIAFIVWLIVFFKDVHLDEEKAFGKYKK